MFAQNFGNNQVRQAANFNSIFSLGVSQARKPQPSKSTIFTSQESPWSKAPEQIKRLFTEECIKYGKVSCQNIQHKFQKGIDQPLNICCSTPQNTSHYYRCWTCMRVQKQTRYTFGICTKCFDKSQHQEHYYELCSIQMRHRGGLFAIQERQQIYCICGKDLFEEGRAPFGCKAHTKNNEQIVPLNINQQKQEQFNVFWGTLFDIYFYLKQQGFAEMKDLFYAKILKSLGELISNSLENIRLFTNFVCSHKIRYSNKKQEIGKPLIQSFYNEQNPLVSKLCLSIAMSILSDQDSAIKYLKYFGQNHDKLKLHQQISQTIQQKISFSAVLMDYKCYQIFNKKQSFSILIRKKKYIPQLISYLEYLEKSTKDQEQFVIQVIRLFTYFKNGHLVRQVGQFLLVRLFAYASTQEQNQESDGQSEPRSNINKVSLRKLINKLIFSQCSGRPEQLLDFRHKIQQLYPAQINKQQTKQEQAQKKQEKSPEKHKNQVKFASLFGVSNSNKKKETKKHKKKIQHYTSSDVVNCLNQFLLSNLTNKNDISYPHLLLILGSEKKQLFCNMLFDKIIQQPSILNANSQQFNIQVFLNIVVLIVHYRLFFRKYEDEDYQSEEELRPQRQYRENLLKECITELKSLQNLKNIENQFRIPNFKKVIKQTCIYNIESQVFFFNEQNRYPNKKALLLANIFGKNLVDACLCQFTLADRQLFLPVDELQKDIVNRIFIQSSFFKKLESFFELQKNKINNHGQPIDNYFVKKYLLTLVLLDILCEGRHQQVRQRIKKLTEEDNQQIEILYKVQDKGVVNKYLNITDVCKQQIQSDQKNQAQKNQKQKQIQMQTAKREQEQMMKKLTEKSKETKLAKYNKMKQKRDNALKKLTTQSMNRLVSDQSETCLLCRQKGKPKNQLVYLIRANKNFTQCNALFGKQNKASTKISTCFHSIHLQCYLQQKKKSSISKCPLCSQNVTAVLPHVYNKGQKKLNRICTNTIINSFFSGYNIYDIQNVFILLFRHLIQSHGLASIVNINRYEQLKRKRERVDQYLQNFIFQMYVQASTQLKEEYDESIQQLLKEIASIENKQIREIQQLMVYALLDKMRAENSLKTMQNLKDLASTLKNQQFEIIKEEVQQLGLDTSQIMKDKISDIQQKDKKSIAKFYPQKPPKFAYQLSKFGEEQCHFCKKKEKNVMCLICGFTMCGSCQQSQAHRYNHQQKKLTFLFSEAQIMFESDTKGQSRPSLFGTRNGIQHKSDLYFNDMMVGLSKIAYPVNNQDSFILNQAVFSKYENYLFND